MQLYNQNVIFEIKGLEMKWRMSEVGLTVGVKGPGLQKGTLKVIFKWEKRPVSKGVVLSAQDEGYIALDGLDAQA